MGDDRDPPPDREFALSFLDVFLSAGWVSQPRREKASRGLVYVLFLQDIPSFLNYLFINSSYFTQGYVYLRYCGGRPSTMSAEVPDNSMSQRPSPCPMWYAQELHLQERRKMITNMCVFFYKTVTTFVLHRARLLQARKPNAPVEWMQKLPQMARRLEESLFRSANSFVIFKHKQEITPPMHRMNIRTLRH